MLQLECFSIQYNQSDDIMTYIAKIEDLCHTLNSPKEETSDNMVWYL